MKMRQLRNMVVSKMAYSTFRNIKVDVGSYTPTVAETIQHMDMCDVMKPEPVPMYVVARKKDNVVVLETESREEADALIVKHAKQKKAALYVLSDSAFAE